MATHICLLALIGLPATGKTTFSKWLLGLPQKPLNIIHICYDDILPHLSNENTSETYFEFKKERTKILSFICKLIESLKTTGKVSNVSSTPVKASLHTDNQDFVIICDDNNYYRSMRYKIYQLCRQTECAYAQIYFGFELKLALERNRARPSKEQVSNETIQKMEGRLETPNPEKNQWESNTLVLSDCENYNANINQILTFLRKTFEKALYPVQVPVKVEAVQSLVHQLDLQLRKRIAEILQSVKIRTERQQKAYALNLQRKEILKKTKLKAENGATSFGDLNEYVNLLH